MRLCTLYCYIRCRGAAANTRVSSYCVSILHSELSTRPFGVRSGPSYRGIRSEPHLSADSVSRKISSDFGYRGVRSVPHLSADSVSRKISSDLGYSGSRTESYDSGLGGSRTASSDSVCGGSATLAANTPPSTSHLVEGYRKMTLQPHEESKL